MVNINNVRGNFFQRFYFIGCTYIILFINKEMPAKKIVVFAIYIRLRLIILKLNVLQKNILVGFNIIDGN